MSNAILRGTICSMILVLCSCCTTSSNQENQQQEPFCSVRNQNHIVIASTLTQAGVRRPSSRIINDMVVEVPEGAKSFAIMEYGRPQQAQRVLVYGIVEGTIGIIDEQVGYYLGRYERAEGYVVFSSKENDITFIEEGTLPVSGENKLVICDHPED